MKALISSKRSVKVLLPRSRSVFASTHVFSSEGDLDRLVDALEQEV